ncbi:hypothetical protein SS50377_27729 [Spironucleus salmonicida]|uniref:Uncharacterized protein n=1 Tax=Spironucleus salmonicida TaxID=348837 RepID=A0A9P8LKF5_9EUKA|nr:hypothetical protein SS50377_27729 [Spironucleus salmonicida]
MTDQDQNTKSEAKPTQLTFSSLDKDLLELQQDVVFSFIGIQFKISEVGDAVCYLKVAIDTVETLSLLHLFMWQHRQGLLLRSNIQLIVVQDELKEHSISVSEYWRNLASLSLQMGFSTMSFNEYNDILLQKSTHQMIIVSDFPRIDSQQLDTMEGLSNFQFDDKMSYSMKLVILERIGLAAHKQQQYAHLLPMILGYSAYIIYNQIIQYQKQDMESIVKDTVYIKNKDIDKEILDPNFPQVYIHHAQEVYTTATVPSEIQYKATILGNNGNKKIKNFTFDSITQVFKNIFELPIHLIDLFKFDGTNKFIFQQMCDVSYLFKAQYFAVFSAFFPLENAVMSQSSRSGKTVTLHTIFYFNLFSGLKIPILINTGFTKDSHDLKTQPLYNRGSIEMDQKLKTLFSAYQSQTDLGDVISSNLKDGVEYSKTMAYVKTECFNLIKTYDMHTAQQQLEGAFELYLQGTSVFCEFSVTGLLDFFKFDPSEQLEQTKQVLQSTTQALNDEIQKFIHERDFAKKIIDTLNQEDKSKKQKEIKKYEDSIRAIEQQIGILQQRTDYYATQKTSIQSDNVESYNSNKEVMLLVDECMTQQKGKYALCTSALVRITYQFVDKFMENAKSSIEEVVKKVKLQSSEQVEQLLNWLEMREHNSKADPVDYNNKSLYLKEADQKITQIISDPTEVQRYFLTLISSELFKNCKAYKIIDLMGISSPNFINLRESQTVKESFQEMMSDITKYTTLEVFREKLYQFLLMLYNPRGIETIFWRNVSSVMNQGADTISSFHKSIEVKDKLNDYIGRNLQDEQKLIDFFIGEFGVKIIFPDCKIYAEIPFISVKVTHLLAAGTDLALINFLRQNQFLYTSENSRGKTPYTQSNILGTSQMHPSCLTQSYYKDMRITTQTDDSMRQQVNDKVKNMNIKDFYLTMVPELAAELQFLCPLICPQIIIKNSTSKYLFNSTRQYQYNIGEKIIDLNILSSHRQILNSLFIEREDKQVGATSLGSNRLALNKILKSQSIQDFNNNLRLTSSSSLNREVVFILSFTMSQKFLEDLAILTTLTDEDLVQQSCGAQQILCQLNQQQVSEISAALLLIVSLCQNSDYETGMKLLMNQISKDSQFLEIYENPYYKYTAVTEIKLDTLYKQLKSLFKEACFMFLQQSFDKFFNAKSPTLQEFFQHAIDNAGICYAKLLSIGQIKAGQKLAIITIVDKNHISNVFFKPLPPMPDYLISLFGVRDQQVIDFSDQRLLSINAHSNNGYQFSSLNFLIESGNHIPEEVSTKQKDIEVALCFQISSKQKTTVTQIVLFHKNGHALHNDEQDIEYDQERLSGVQQCAHLSFTQFSNQDYSIGSYLQQINVFDEFQKIWYYKCYFQYGIQSSIQKQGFSPEYEIHVDCFWGQNYFLIPRQQNIRSVLRTANPKLFLFEAVKINKSDANNKESSVSMHIIVNQHQHLFQKLGNLYETLEVASPAIRLQTNVAWIPNKFNTCTENPIQITIEQINSLILTVESCRVENSIQYRFLSNPMLAKFDLGTSTVMSYLLNITLFPIAVEGQILVVNQLAPDHSEFVVPEPSKSEEQTVEDASISQYHTLCQAAKDKYISELSEREIEFLQKKEDEVFDAAYALLQFDDGAFTFKVKYQYQMSITRRQRTSFKEDCFETIYESKENLLETFIRLKAVIVAIKEGVVHVIILE